MSSYFQAGDLFSLEDLQIIQDLRLVLTKIREIISAPDFGSNHNDQSLVEICITRITSGKCPFELIFFKFYHLDGQVCINFGVVDHLIQT